MKNHYLKNLIIFVSAVFLTSIYCGYGKKKSRPIYYNESEYVKEELYNQILKAGDLPKITSLSQKAQGIITAENGISYSEENGLIFKYDKSYPVNIPLSALLTAGKVIYPKELMVSGTRLDPKNLHLNAELRR